MKEMVELAEPLVDAVAVVLPKDDTDVDAQPDALNSDEAVALMLALREGLREKENKPVTVREPPPRNALDPVAKRVIALEMDIRLDCVTPGLRVVVAEAVDDSVARGEYEGVSEID